MSELIVPMELHDVTAADLEGELVIPEGRYHIQITGVRLNEKGTPCLIFRYEVLAGTNSAAVGSVASERFFLSEQAKKRLAILAHRLGFLSDADFGGRKVIDWNEAVHSELVVQIIHEKYTTQKGVEATTSKWGYGGFFAANDSRVADVPRGKPRGTSRVARPAASPQPVPAGAAAAAAGSYDDL